MRSAAPLALLLLAACTAEPGPPATAPTPAAAPAEAVADPAPPAEETPALTAAPEGQVLLAFSCRGGDPAWRLHLDGDGRATLRDDGDRDDLELSGFLEPVAGGYAYRAAPDASPSETFAALVTPGACFVEEGRAAWPFTAQLSHADGRQASGCCRGEFGLDVFAATDFAAAGAEDWTRDLARRADLVERCALDAGVDTDAVTSLRESDDGTLVVRLRDSDGARFDCRIDAQARDIESVEPASGDEPVSHSEWLPADPDARPHLTCGRIYREVAADGRLRGWVPVLDGC